MSIPTISNSTTAPDGRSTVRSSSGQTSATGAGASNRASGQSGTPQTSVDAVSISTQAVDLQALEASIRQMPEVDATRVTELREQINAGQYQVDGRRVADKILAFEQKF